MASITSVTSAGSCASLAPTLIDVGEDDEEPQHRRKRPRRAAYLAVFKLVQKEEDVYQCLLCNSEFKGVSRDVSAAPSDRAESEPQVTHYWQQATPRMPPEVLSSAEVPLYHTARSARQQHPENALRREADDPA